MEWEHKGDPIFDESAADAIVISNLRKEIRRLKRKYSMILHDNQNNLYEVREDDARLLTPEERNSLIARLQSELAQLQAAPIAEATNTAPDPAPATEQPIDQAPPAPQIQ